MKWNRSTNRSSSGWGTRHRTISRISLLTVLAFCLAACSGTPAAEEQASQDVAALGDALADAVILSYQASQGRAEPDAGALAVNEARALTLSLSETSAALDSDTQVLSLQLIELANQAIVWVGQTEYERAEKLRLEEFLPAAQQFETALTAPAVEPTAVASTSSQSNGTAIAFLSAIALTGALVFARYRRRDIPDPIVEGRKRRAERSGQPIEPRERKWSEIPTLDTEPTPTDPTAEEPDSARSTKVRTMEVDLRGLLMTALHQVKDYGWDMSIVCPELQVNADPLKLRQAVLGALRSAFMGGAQRVGIVVEDIEGHVLLTIGRDVPPDQTDAERIAEKFTTQVRLALGLDEIESAVIEDEDVSLMSVSLGRKVGADEVSEPVV